MSYQSVDLPECITKGQHVLQEQQGKQHQDPHSPRRTSLCRRFI